MATDRTASTVWEGDLQSGKGTVTLESSKVVDPLEVTAPSRFESPEGRTSPEELIAAAHSSCYSMALSNLLTQDGTPPERLETSATCTIDRVDGAFTITTMALQVRATVPGVDAGAFEQAAGKAKDACPVSKALAGNVEISLDAALR